MPTPAYVTLVGTKQGLITAGTFTEDSVGNIYQEGHEDEALVQAFSHEIIIPRDPQSGQPTGQRVHKPLMIDLLKAMLIGFQIIIFTLLQPQ